MATHRPGRQPKTRRSSSATDQVFRLLRQYESRNITFIDPGGAWPVVWQRARGVHVWDGEGRRYLDLTAAFGVAATGHANPCVVTAGQRQMPQLLHAMGDVHPHALKAELCRELSRITFERWTRHQSKDSSSPLPAIRGKTILCNSGFEAVEAALKSARLATGKNTVIAFEKAYHGLGYGTLNTTHREHFRSPFRAQLGEFGRFVPFPAEPADLQGVESSMDEFGRRHDIGAVLVEPIQVRGGVNLPPPGFLPRLRRWCDAHGALLVLDEIYTGFGRTGRWFACEHSATVPDLICLGKALTGGFPLSACVGRAELMDAAWPPSSGEAIHTSTFLGHPVGCAMALAQITEIRRRRLVERSARLGEELLRLLESLPIPDGLCARQRGRGLLAGLELCWPDGSPATRVVLETVQAMLRRGFILLPEGEHGHVISFTPPLTISRTQLERCLRSLADALVEADLSVMKRGS